MSIKEKKKSFHPKIMLSSSKYKGVKKCVEEAGIGFMMAPMYHPAMKVVGPVRKKLKVKTVFNILGPMLNPAQVPFAVVGVYHEDIVSSPWITVVAFTFIVQLITFPFSMNYPTARL